MASAGFVMIALGQIQDEVLRYTYAFVAEAFVAEAFAGLAFLAAGFLAGLAARAALRRHGREADSAMAAAPDHAVA